MAGAIPENPLGRKDKPNELISLLDVRPGQRFTTPQLGEGIVYMRVYGGIIDSQSREITAVQLEGEQSAPGTLDRIPLNNKVSVVIEERRPIPQSD